MADGLARGRVGDGDLLAARGVAPFAGDQQAGIGIGGGGLWRVPLGIGISPRLPVPQRPCGAGRQLHRSMRICAWLAERRRAVRIDWRPALAPTARARAPRERPPETHRAVLPHRVVAIRLGQGARGAVRPVAPHLGQVDDARRARVRLDAGGLAGAAPAPGQADPGGAAAESCKETPLVSGVFHADTPKVRFGKSASQVELADLLLVRHHFRTGQSGPKAARCCSGQGLDHAAHGTPHRARRARVRPARRLDHAVRVSQWRLRRAAQWRPLDPQRKAPRRTAVAASTASSPASARARARSFPTTAPGPWAARCRPSRATRASRAAR